MIRRNNTGGLVVMILALLAIALSICALLLSLFPGQIVITVNNINSWLSLIGIIFSTIVFAIGGYFAVLAVSAYSHVREIEHIRESIDRLFTEKSEQFSRLESTGNATMSSMASVYDDFVSDGESILLIFEKILDNLVRPSDRLNYRMMFQESIFKLRKQRGNMALKNSFMEVERRSNLIRELCGIIEYRSDIEAVFEAFEKILKDDKEPKDIKNFIEKEGKISLEDRISRS